MAAGPGRRAGHRRTGPVLRRRRRPPARAGRQLQPGPGRAREGDRAHHQPRRQGGGVLHQGTAEGRRRAGSGAGIPTA
ncbi:hypothetical protein G6F31_021428 [Rhizopus arrhizus]|nr:hypothetical protein G6F31_021428 [Rhizopus arrhizus]